MFDKWIIFALGAVILFGLGSFFGKVASNSDVSSRVYFFEALGTLSIFSIYFLVKKSEILSGFHFNLFGLLMGISWGLGTIMFILALDKSKLSVLVPFTALYPAVTIILALLFLGERLNSREIAGILLATAAGLLLVK